MKAADQPAAVPGSAIRSVLDSDDESILDTGCPRRRGDPEPRRACDSPILDQRAHARRGAQCSVALDDFEREGNQRRACCSLCLECARLEFGVPTTPSTIRLPHCLTVNLLPECPMPRSPVSDRAAASDRGIPRDARGLWPSHFDCDCYRDESPRDVFVAAARRLNALRLATTRSTLTRIAGASSPERPLRPSANDDRDRRFGASGCHALDWLDQPVRRIVPARLQRSQRIRAVDGVRDQIAEARRRRCSLRRRRWASERLRLRRTLGFS